MNEAERQKIKDILDRGVEKIYPDRKSLEEKLIVGNKIKLYCGYDPSGPSLHLGHMITLKKLSQFQKLGHKVVMLLGDFTGMIGDPTDKLAVRKKLTREEVLKNSINYKKLASKFLCFSGVNPAEILYNSRWSDKLSFSDLIELAANFTVGQMITREMFQQRLRDKKPIYLHEFLYPLAQAYDSLAMDVDLEIGGNDQTFNMLCGRELMRAVKNKEKFVLALKLLADHSGKKMGKSEGNMVRLDEDPKQMFGKIMSWPDELIVPGMDLLTDIPSLEIDETKEDMQKGKINPRDAKARLAREIITACHDKDSAILAEKEFEKVFKERELPSEIEGVDIREGEINIVDLVFQIGLAKSKSEAKRLILQGGFKIEGSAEKDWKKTVKIKKGQVFQGGRGKFKKII
ncbi:MAG: tyrosine--tRNA ligase [Parcubacteria group bacterium]